MFSLSNLKRIGFVLLIIAPAIVIHFGSTSNLVVELTSKIQTFLPLYVISLLIFKAVSIIYPPLPGIAVTLASVPLIGWPLAYVTDIVGGALGASVSFFLGKKYGFTILQKMVGETATKKLKTIKLKQKNQVEASVFFRFSSGGMLSDALSWGASLIGFRYAPFISGYVISHLLTTLPIFYLFGMTISTSLWVLIGLTLIIAWIVIFRLRSRYFEHNYE